MSAPGEAEFVKLSWRHGLMGGSGEGCLVEECCLVVGKVQGYGSIKSASRINGAVVIFLDERKVKKGCGNWNRG